MPSLVDRVRSFASSEHGRRLVKFASVSVISTLISQVVLILTYDVISIPSAVACNIIATGVATVPAYWLNRTWTWNKRGKSDPWREVIPFWVIAFIGLVLSTVAVGIAAAHADSLFQSHVMRKGFIQVANLFTYAVIWVGRYFIFNKYLFKAAPVDERGEKEVPGEVEAIVAEEHRVHDRDGRGDDHRDEEQHPLGAGAG